MMSMKEVHAKLVNPILALDEYVELSKCDSTIVVTISEVLKNVLNEIEQEVYFNKSEST